MSVVTSSVGLATGIDTGAIIDALIGAQRGTISKLTNRQAAFRAEAGGLDALSAFALSVGTAAERLGNAATFDALTVAASDPDALAVSAEENAPPGATVFTPLRSASAHAAVTRGFASPDAAVGAGELVFSRHAGVRGETPLDLLNGGAGVRRGEVRVTDAAGNVAAVDLSAARTTRDVLDAFNNADGVALNARVEGGAFVLEDLSNPDGSAGSLTVGDLAGGRTARDLGLAGSGAGRVTGEEVYAAAGAFTFDLLDDGLGLKTVGERTGGDGDEPADDLGVELADGTTFALDLDAAPTLAGLVAALNGHADNGGKLTAALVDDGAGGRLVLTDHTDPPQVPDPDGGGLLGGGGTVEADTELTLTNLNGADVLRGLGLTTAVQRDIDGAGSDDRLTGARLVAGLDSVLLRNLAPADGGGPIAGGTVRLTDRAGASATLDLSAAESLDEVVSAVNSAGLGLRAEVTESGLTLADATGGTGAVTVEDLSGTLAADLGLAGSFTSNTVTGTAAARRSVGRTTALADFADGPVRGELTATDSAGVAVTLDLGELGDGAALGDLLDAFNSAAGDAGAGVTAELNATGDGFRLVDTAGGAGELELNRNSAADALRLTGAVKNGALSARDAAVVTLGEGDTLRDLADRLNAGGFGISAQIADDGTTLAPSRLLLTATATGAAGRFRVNDSGLAAPFAGARAGLSAEVSVRGADALLAVGADAGAGFLRADADGVFENLPGGVGVTLKQATGEPVTVTVGRDDSGVGRALAGFVSAYNGLAGLAGDLTKFDAETNERGVLQGNATVGRVLRRVGGLLTRRFGPDRTATVEPGEARPPRTLFDLGVRVGRDGRLSLKQDRLDAALAADPAAVANFFRDPEAGFAAAAGGVIDSLTDPFDGLLEREGANLDRRQAQIDDRVADLEAQLGLKRDRLVRQFAAMEEAVSRINSFQSALSNIRPLELVSRDR